MGMFQGPGKLNQGHFIFILYSIFRNKKKKLRYSIYWKFKLGVTLVFLAGFHQPLSTRRASRRTIIYVFFPLIGFTAHYGEYFSYLIKTQ